MIRERMRISEEVNPGGGEDKATILRLQRSGNSETGRGFVMHRESFSEIMKRLGRACANGGVIHPEGAAAGPGTLLPAIDSSVNTIL